MFTEEVAQQLKSFARLCMDNPSLLHDPALYFVKELIEYFGGKIPDKVSTSSSQAKSEAEESPKKEEPKPESEPESEESDLELDMTGVIGLYLKKIFFFLML